MCGLSVIYSPVTINIQECTKIVNQQLHLMKARGPDASNLITNNKNLVMGHNRLSIIGLEPESNQPMSYGNRFFLVFNGEIYNYQDIRTDLMKCGETFKTTSDTEVILIGFKVYGIEIFSKLRGMFAIIIYDSLYNKLYISRDSFGIKPLYFHKTKDGRYFFASSIKAIKNSFKSNISKDLVSKILFDWFGFIPEPKTVYNEINAINPGINYVFSNTGVQLLPRIDELTNIYKKNYNTVHQAHSINNISSWISESIGKHLIADVPLSLFLSSGIDSNLIAYLSHRDHKHNLFGQTLSVDSLIGTKFDETNLAIKTSKKLGMEINIKNADVDYIYACSNLILEAMDQPSVDGLNIFMLSRELQNKKFKVALVGTGADELLCGYNFYNSLPLISNIKQNQFFKLLSKTFNKRINNSKLLKLFDSILPYKDILDSYLLQRSLNSPFALSEQYGLGAVKDTYEYLRSIFDDDLVQSTICKRHKLMYFDQTFYLKNQLLKDCDWASMAHSIEIRTPFVDKDLLNLVLCSGVNKKKNIKQFLAYTQLNNISSLFYKRKKTGFAVPLSKFGFNQEKYTQSLKDKQEQIYDYF